MVTPKCVENKLTQLCELCEKHPEYIPVPELARFLHAKADGIQNSIDRGQCPFGFSWGLGSRKAYKVPTVKFYLWYTNSGATLPLEEGA